MKKMKSLFGALAIGGAVIMTTLPTIPVAQAHSGGTDAYGCHTNHKTGVYHCH